METYIILMEMTSKGLDKINNIPDFVETLERKIKDLGGKLLGFYKVMGEIDYVATIETPDDKVALALVVALGKSGYFTTTTLKAYSVSEMRKSLEIFDQKLS